MHAPARSASAPYDNSVHVHREERLLRRDIFTHEHLHRTCTSLIGDDCAERTAPNFESGIPIDGQFVLLPSTSHEGSPPKGATMSEATILSWPP